MKKLSFVCSMLLIITFSYSQSDIKELKKIIVIADKNRKDAIKENNKNYILKIKKVIKYYDAALMIEPNNVMTLYKGYDVCMESLNKCEPKDKFFYLSKGFNYIDKLINYLKKRQEQEFNSSEIKELGLDKKYAKVRDMINLKITVDNDIEKYLSELKDNQPIQDIRFGIRYLKNSRFYTEMMNAYVSNEYKELMSAKNAKLEDFNGFLILYPDYKYNNKVIKKRDELAFNLLLNDKNLNDSLVDVFISLHPSIQNYKSNSRRLETWLDSAIHIRNDLAYERLDKSSYNACVEYLYAYPRSQHEGEVLKKAAINYFNLAIKVDKSDAFQNFINKYPEGITIQDDKLNNLTQDAIQRRNVAFFKEAIIGNTSGEKKVSKLNKLISNLYGEQGQLFYKSGVVRDSIAFQLLNDNAENYIGYNRFISQYPNSDLLDDAIEIRNRKVIDYALETYDDDINMLNRFMMKLPIYPTDANSPNHDDFLNLEIGRLKILLFECQDRDPATAIKNYRMFLYLFKNIAPNDILKEAEIKLKELGIDDPYSLN
jgi:hypothetical protein